MNLAIGLMLARIGWAISAINYFLTAIALFNQDKKGLALIQLLLPPAELVLPWVASTFLGLMSATGCGLVLLGLAIGATDRRLRE